ncbi:hypothetical protein B7P43_G05324 [Cryptotermes secundus]|uniref:CABIT domain-containing protein n=2 Tax=Cryptotermes secundus TaxID=105785 RepID=A0A2J7RFW5_9NEOP|nr:uncharacterized protein LOC111861343 [Cryptotermes secundus]PNF39726.1 hypothetical protein B7P43_G05324 [Cryptotermes secundus]
MSSEISTTRSLRSTRSNRSSSSASGRLQSLLPGSQHCPVQLSVRYSSSLEHAPHQKDKGVRRSATSSSLERLTPRQFLDKYSLPRVVRVVTPSGDNGNSDGDLEQRRLLLGPLAEPLLLYRQYKSTKVQARSVQTAKLWKTVGPSLVIPDSYQGWFSLVTPKGQLMAPCYSDIQQLITAQVTRFLTKTQLTAYKLNDSKDAIHDSVRKRAQYTKTIVPAGNILKLLAVFEDVTGSRNSALSNKRLSLPLIGRSHNNTRYAQCLNNKNQMVFVPLSTTGQFFAVSLGGAGVEARHGPLYLLPQLLREHRLPVRVHLMAGPLPTPLPVGFTGTLLLEGYQEEDVILACTLPHDVIIHSNSRTGSNHLTNASPVTSAVPKLLEMDADSRFFLTRPLFHHEFESRLFKSPLLQTALAFCRDRGDFWRRQIKVTHHIFPSQREVASEAEGKKSTTQRQPAQEGQEKVSKTKNKSRRTTKKSSSFTYTPSSSRATNFAHDLSAVPHCNYKNAISQQRGELRTQDASDAERLVDNFTPSAICHHKNESRPHQRPYIDLCKHDAKSQLYSCIQNRDLPSIVTPAADDLPYSDVADAIGDIDKCEEENIYAEICECDTKENDRRKLNYYYLKTNSENVREDYYYVELEGGSDGTFSGTLSSSDPSSRDDDTNYDTVC